MAEFQPATINGSMQIRHRIMTMAMALALFVAIGGPLAVLQGIAWVNMVHDFSKTGSLTQAVEKTFDGKHPCLLCKKISYSLRISDLRRSGGSAAISLSCNSAD